MRFRGKRVVVILVVISVLAVNFHTNFEEAQAIEPFFTLVARGFNVRHMDYLNLIKIQLARIGIHITIELVNYSIGTISGFSNLRNNFDLQVYELHCGRDDPFHPVLYSENGSLNLAGYHTSLDWDDNLGEGRNEWYIQTGLEMTPNNSQERVNHCFEWQHYMMGEILPVLPLFTQKEDHSFFELLYFSVKEVRPIVGSRDPAPGYPSKSKGLLVRKAIAYAINLEEIRSVILGDEYEIIYHPTFPTMDDWLSPNSFRYCHNLEYARSLMRAAGYDVACGQPKNPFEYLDWEDVCGNNPTTIGVEGFSFELICISITLLSAVNLLYLIKRKRNA